MTVQKILAFILISSILSINLVVFGGEPKQDDTKQAGTRDIPTEISIIEAKKYLEDNYDKVKIDGSTSMIPLHQSLNDLFLFNKESVWHNKTVEAFEKFISGDNDILLGVDYSDELLEKAENAGIELSKKEITREAFVFLINKANPVKSLTTDQIKDIYSGKITNWSEVGGDDAPIKAYQRNSDSGSQIRMSKFMGDTKLMDKDVEYISSMGYVVEQIGNYDEGRYSIAYNMYTFTEKQYVNSEVILLDVDGVHPNDESIFDETYPINIYNYIYCDENNVLASEFASNLYIYLMSDEGQKLISDSGYVNINKNYDRNMDIDKPYDYDYGTEIGFHSEEKGEFYDIDINGGLLVFTNFVDYVLHDTKYINNKKANDYLALISNSSIVINPHTIGLYEEKGTLTLNPWFDASLDPEDFFNYKYDNMYYSTFTYFIDEDKYVLATEDKNLFDNYSGDGYLADFSAYVDNYVPSSTLEITKDELKNLYLRTFDYDFMTQSGVEIKFFQPFN